jgi:hypothetical protein
MSQLLSYHVSCLVIHFSQEEEEEEEKAALDLLEL